MRITRSSENKMVAGVCAGIAESVGLDAALLRILFVFCTVFGIGSPIIIYLILSVVLPKQDLWDAQ
jgi:phage shock protein C